MIPSCTKYFISLTLQKSTKRIIVKLLLQPSCQPVKYAHMHVHMDATTVHIVTVGILVMMYIHTCVKFFFIRSFLHRAHLFFELGKVMEKKGLTLPASAESAVLFCCSMYNSCHDPIRHMINSALVSQSTSITPKHHSKNRNTSCSRLQHDIILHY